MKIESKFSIGYVHFFRIHKRLNDVNMYKESDIKEVCM